MPAAGSFLRAKRDNPDAESHILDVSNLHERDASKNNDLEEVKQNNTGFTLGNNFDQESDMDYIEEDITPGVGNGRDYEFYQPPISGGIPIKMTALDS